MRLFSRKLPSDLPSARPIGVRGCFHGSCRATGCTDVPSGGGSVSALGLFNAFNVSLSLLHDCNSNLISNLVLLNLLLLLLYLLLQFQFHQQ